MTKICQCNKYINIPRKLMIRISKKANNKQETVFVHSMMFFRFFLFFFSREEHLCVRDSLGWASDFGQR